MIPNTLGRPVRDLFRLDPDFLSVNHGSFGATPIQVLAARQAWQDQLEAQPTRFMRTVLPGAIRDAAEHLGAFLGVSGSDIVFVDNATSGCNAVLRSLRLDRDDEVLVLTHGYNAVRNTVRYVTSRAGARMTEAPLPFPRPDADAVIAAVRSALTPRTRLAVMDHITSASAVVLPIHRLVAACHAASVPVLVDGAHGPGQVDLDLKSIGADWYTGNCHKWLCAPKGAAFLHVAADRQSDLHPTVVSHGLGQGFLAEFDWTGTRDPGAILSVPASLAFHEQLGGAALRARNIALAADAVALLCDRLGCEPGAAGALAGAMGVIRLPMAATEESARAMRDRLLAAGTDAPVFLLDGAVWLRVSAFAYNEIEDYARLATIVARILGEIAA